jgi:20S proteasome, alpha and beta subunits
MLTPYDFQENLQQRAQYIRNRLRAGSPVIGISYDNGILLLALKRRGRKVYEVYDRLMFSAIGNQADVENLRLAAIDFAHQEGFVRSPDDVTIQRVVGFALSPALKKAFGDPLTTPFVARALFAELHDAPERDQFYTLNYDGEFLPYERFAAIGGTQTAEEQATRYLEAQLTRLPTLESALPIALIAWGVAYEAAQQEDADSVSEDAARNRLREMLGEAQVEVGILERQTLRENRFRLLAQEQLEPYLKRL